MVEVGSGSGATSVVVMEALAHLADRLEFVYTDLSPQLVAHGRKTYGARYPFASFQLLDVEKDTEEQVAPSQCVPHSRRQQLVGDLSDAIALCELQLRSHNLQHGPPGIQSTCLTAVASVQGYTNGSFDVLLATNVLHATADMTNTLQRCKQLLRRDSLLIANELTAKTEFLTLTFGLTDGWWLYHDGCMRLPGSPLLSRQALYTCQWPLL